MPDPVVIAKDSTGRTFVDLPASDFSNRTWVGYNFSQEQLEALVFPADTVGLVLERCNCDNVAPHPGVTMVNCSNRRFAPENDLRDWERGPDNKPLRVLNEKSEIHAGRSVDPVDIPAFFTRRERLPQAVYLAEMFTPAFRSWFLEDPQIVASKTEKEERTVSVEEWDAMRFSRNFSPFDEEPYATEVIRKSTDSIKQPPETAFKEVRNQYGEPLLDDKGGKILREVLLPVPNKEIPIETLVICLTGPITYVTIVGNGKFKGGIGHRTMVNTVEDDAPKAKG